MAIGIVSHFYNEEMLLPYFIRHYKPLVEEAIMVDHKSTDTSREIIKSLAPDWKIVDTKLKHFDAHELDAEVQEHETQLKTTWKFSPNVTELIFCKDLKDILEEHGKDFDAIGLRAYMMVDPEEIPLPSDGPIFKDRTWGYLDDESALASRRWRYIHKKEHGAYALGRHGVGIEKQTRSEDWNILFLHFSPWPQSLARKSQILGKRSPSDIAGGLGIQHGTEDQIKAIYEQEKPKARDLLLDKKFKEQYDYYTLNASVQSLS
jgi:hypothetical protein